MGLQVVGNVSSCQALCARTDGCLHFSYWLSFRHCHLQDASAIREEGQMSWVSGPSSCAPARVLVDGQLHNASVLALDSDREYASRDSASLVFGRPLLGSIWMVVAALVSLSTFILRRRIVCRERAGYGSLPTQSS